MPDVSATHGNAKGRSVMRQTFSTVTSTVCARLARTMRWHCALPACAALSRNLLWTWSKPHIEYSSLLVWQRVNHFPNRLVTATTCSALRLNIATADYFHSSACVPIDTHGLSKHWLYFT
jgi:hypothetical protein